MKRFMLLLLVAAFCIPQLGRAQYVSWNNLKIQAGAAFPWIQSSFFDLDNRRHLTFRPHIKASYKVSVHDNFRMAVFSGYNQLGGKYQQSTDDIKKRRTFTWQTVSLGLIALLDYQGFQIGPIFSWNYLLSTEYHLEHRSDDGTWVSLLKNDFPQRYLRDQIILGGFSIQRQFGSHFSVNLEGLYGLNDIFINEDRWPESIRIGNVQMYPGLYRLSIGYSF